MALTKAHNRMIEGAPINVKDYGAVGDGTTDDTAAIQAALDSGRRVDFGEKGNIYPVSAPLSVQSGTVITGAFATIKQLTALTYIFNVDLKTDISISGITFLGLGTDYAESDANPYATAVYTNSGTIGLTIFNNKFTNFGYAGIRLREATNVNIYNNEIISLTVPVAGVSGRGYGVLVDYGCSNVTLQGNKISKGGQGFRIESCSELVVSGNTISGIVGQHGIYMGSDMQNCLVSDNVINGTALQGIKLQTQNSSIKNDNISITGNVITGTGDAGIAVLNSAGGTLQPVQNHNINIYGNTIRGSGASGINVQNATTCKVSGNCIHESVGSGIVYSSCSFIAIDNNLIIDADHSGIRDQSASTNVSIKSNTIHNCATSSFAGDLFGIFVQNGTELDIIGNKITDSAANMSYGIYVAGGDQATQSIESNQVLASTTQAIRFASSATALRAFKNNTLVGSLGSAANSTALPVIASASSITLPTGQDVFSITGTTNITDIGLAGHVGHVVTFNFTSAVTVVRGGSVLVASNFVADVNDTLTMMCNGNFWLEMSRSSN